MTHISKLVAIIFAAGLLINGQAQTQSVTTISTSPSGIAFTVDGTSYIQAMSATWPQGSKHYIYAEPEQDSSTYHSRFTFQGWQWSGGILQGNPGVITADPSIRSYQALFSVSYGLNILFNPCSGQGPCAAPGYIAVNGTNIFTSQEIYEAGQSTVVLQAYPSPGYVFAGWQSAASQAIEGFQTTVTMNGPVTLTALFEPVQFVNLATVPAGLTLLADRSMVFTPVAMEWGLNTVHTLYANSPQQDLQGGNWVFSSWSDGGALQHAYKVSGYTATTVTATYVPGVPVELVTSPLGLTLSVDGNTKFPSNTFVWGVGETHSLQAPAQQNDSKGHTWAFANWSNGGSAAQSLTVPQSAVGSGMRLTANYSQLGHLTVTSALAGLSVMVNGSACALPCDVLQPLGTQLTVSAPPSVPGSAGTRQDFAGWSSGGSGALSVTLGADTITVAANYRQMNYLAVAASPSGAASFSAQPASPDGFYDAQSSVTVSVTPLPGFRFRNWSGDLTGASLSGAVTMNAPRSVQALFDKVPYIAPAGVSNGAGATPQTGVAPGSIVSLFGANLGNTTQLGPSSPMVQTLAGTTVRLGDRLLPLFFASPAQINFQLPADVQTGSQSVTVSTQGQPDVQATFNIVQDAPGLFPNQVDGQTYAVATHADGSAVTTAAPAQQGEVITLYGTGFGPSTPARPFGFAVPQSPAYVLNDAATVQIGNAAPVTPSAAYAAPGTIGVDIVQFTLGPDAPSGASVALTLTINGQISNTVLLPIQ